MAPSQPAEAPVGVPDEVQTLLQKHARLRVFVAQFEEELQLLEKVTDACSALATFKENAKHLTLHGPGQPSQVQLKLDLNEWMTAQNNAMMKADIVEVYVKDYRRQIASYEAEIAKRGYSISKQGSLVAATAVPERPSSAISAEGSTATSNP